MARSGFAISAVVSRGDGGTRCRRAALTDARDESTIDLRGRHPRSTQSLTGLAYRLLASARRGRPSECPLACRIRWRFFHGPPLSPILSSRFAPARAAETSRAFISRTAITSPTFGDNSQRVYRSHVQSARAAGPRTIHKPLPLLHQLHEQRLALRDLLASATTSTSSRLYTRRYPPIDSLPGVFENFTFGRSRSPTADAADTVSRWTSRHQ